MGHSSKSDQHHVNQARSNMLTYFFDKVHLLFFLIWMNEMILCMGLLSGFLDSKLVQ